MTYIFLYTIMKEKKRHRKIYSWLSFNDVPLKHLAKEAWIEIYTTRIELHRVIIKN